MASAGGKTTGAMSDKEVKAQLDRMVSFILREADEKANEVRIKAEEEFAASKQSTVQTEKLKLMKEYEKKEKQVDVEKRMYDASLRVMRESYACSVVPSRTPSTRAVSACFALVRSSSSRSWPMLRSSSLVSPSRAMITRSSCATSSSRLVAHSPLTSLVPDTHASHRACSSCRRRRYLSAAVRRTRLSSTPSSPTPWRSTRPRPVTMPPSPWRATGCLPPTRRPIRLTIGAFLPQALTSPFLSTRSPNAPQLWWCGSVGTRGPHRVLEHAGPAVAAGL